MTPMDIQKVKSDHIKLLKEKGKFHIDCSHLIFSQEEIEILERYGHWFEALQNGIIPPFTEQQNELIKVGRFERTPITEYEKAWFKYLARKKIELEQGDSLKVRYTPAEDSFYSREQHKQLHGTIFNVIRKTHKE